MPSPFPGMDPFIEGQIWQDFHATFITVARETLMPQIRPNYVVNVEEYVYIAREPLESAISIKPDVVISESDDRWPSRGVAGSMATVEPMHLTLPVPDRIEQYYMVIRKRKRHQVVTVIELLSPWNKSSEGRADYLHKRNNVFGVHAHLLELDLLRGGERLPTVEPLPTADHYAFLCRAERLPHVEVFAWRLQQRLPTIPVPLAGDDPDASLDLQDIFTTVYDRGGYDYALDYDLGEITPRLMGDNESWAEDVLRSRRAGG